MSVKIYLTERLIDGEKYVGQVCAREWGEAEAIAKASDSTVIGELQSQVCARCGVETDTASTVSKSLRDDDWPEELEG